MAHGQAGLIETNDYDSDQRLPQRPPINTGSNELAVPAKRNEISARQDPTREVEQDIPSDPSCPRYFLLWRKQAIVWITSSTALCVTCTSSLYTSTYEQIKKELRCSRIMATLGLSVFILGLGLGPILLAPLSKLYGRRRIYIISLLFFMISMVPCAVAKNIGTEVTFRCINGLVGGAFLTVAGGTVGDIFDKTSLQAPIMVFTAAPFLGPVLRPILGGFINQFANWRQSFWTLHIQTGLQWLLIVFFVPETYHPVLLKSKAHRLRKTTGEDKWHAPLEEQYHSIPRIIATSLSRPFMLLALDPVCLSLYVYSALLLGILYLFFGAFAVIFEHHHGFSLYQVGLSFLGIGVGMLIAISISPLWHWNYLRLVIKQKNEAGKPLETEPEIQLLPAIVGAPLVTIGIFWFGWTQFPSIHWIVPIIRSGVLGLRMTLVFSGVFTFLVHAYPLYAASALAANSFSRSSFAAVFPLFGIQVYNRLRYEWATTLLALLSLLMAPFPYICYRYRKRIRRRSRFASVAK